MQSHPSSPSCPSQRIIACFAPLLIGSSATLVAQDADFISLVKVQAFEQMSPLIVGLRAEDFGDPDDAPLRFSVSAEATAPNALTGGSVTPPARSASPLAADDFGEELNFSEGFEVFAELNDAFPGGDYTIDLVGANDGAKSVDIELSADVYAGVPVFTNFVAAQAINAASNFTLQWEPIPGGAPDDFVFLSIEDEAGNFIYESPDIGEPGELDGTSTSVTVPAGTLDPGMDYEVVLEIFTPIDFNEDYAPGVTTVSAYGKSTLMLVRTTGAVADGDPPNLDRSVPFPFQSEVALNSVVTFFFNERMDTGVNAGQAITWSGVADPNQFAYSWSADGTVLFCNYVPGLPASAQIDWTLNPAGSAAKLRDVAGNNLPEGADGGFETKADSNVGTPDVEELSIVKGKSFFQEGPAAEDLGSYFAELIVDLSGVGTVSRVDLNIPGRGLEMNVAGFGFDAREIEGESDYAEKADLDRIFPNGDYVVTMHTVHDGVRNVTLSTGPDNYPNAPTIQNFAATQAIDSSRPFQLQWGALAGGTANDFIELIIEGESACFFETEGIGEPGALDGTDTGVTIPAHTLPPGRTLECELVFAKIVDTETAAYPGAVGRAAFLAITEFEIETTGDPFRPQLEFETAGGNQINVTLIGEVGRHYELLESDDLGDQDPWKQVWSGFLFGDCEGFKSTFEYFANRSGVPKRFFQAREVPGGD